MTNTKKADSILIVDDESINLEILAANLAPRYQVRTYTDGAAAIEHAQQTPPDLLLLDVVMPDVDGYEVLRRFKDHPSTRNVPVIFVTGRGAAKEQLRGLSAGAVDYITKPFEMPIVLARVETQLALKRKSDLLERLASIDPITEISNRRQFDDVISREWSRCARGEQSLSLMMIDIDDFKAFNDRYGHPAGDACLRQVAERMATEVNRGEDFIARYGGEEFAVVLPGTAGAAITGAGAGSGLRGGRLTSIRPSPPAAMPTAGLAIDGQTIAHDDEPMRNRSAALSATSPVTARSPIHVPLREP